MTEIKPAASGRLSAENFERSDLQHTAHAHVSGDPGEIGTMKMASTRLRSVTMTGRPLGALGQIKPGRLSAKAAHTGRDGAAHRK